MTPQEAQNRIDVRFLSGNSSVLVLREEWDVVKRENQRLKRIEDSVRLMGVGDE